MYVIHKIKLREYPDYLQRHTNKYHILTDKNTVRVQHKNYTINESLLSRKSNSIQLNPI